MMYHVIIFMCLFIIQKIKETENKKKEKSNQRK